MRIGFAGGGTGGHVFPVQSLIKYIDKHYPGKHTLFWFGEKPSLEYTTYTKLVGSWKAKITYEDADNHVATHPTSKQTSLSFLRVFSGKRRRQKEVLAILQNIGGLFLILVGIFQSLYHILKNKIDVVFCKGGYVSLPVVIAAWILRKRVLLHESDTKAGLANRMCAKFATTIFTGFENVFPGKEIVVGQILDDDLVLGLSDLLKETSASGTPASETIETSDNTSQKIIRDVKKEQTDVLVIGGSQGSQSLYETLYETLIPQGKFVHTHFHIVLGTHNQSYMNRFEKFPFVTVYSFLDQEQMGKILALCDVSLTRGGTTSLAEQELFGIKKIIIPIPWTHDQLKNAKYYVQNHGDVLVEQTQNTFKEDLEDQILHYANYQKQPYTHPLTVITKTKELIVDKILQQ